MSGTYGVFIDGYRPASKKAIKNALTGVGAHNVSLEDTGFLERSPAGPVETLPDGRYTFVGPDPYTKRSFYGTIVKTGTKLTVV